MDEIKALPPQEFQAVWQQIQRWSNSRHEVTTADDPIHSARGMFAGTFRWRNLPRLMDLVLVGGRPTTS